MNDAIKSIIDKHIKNIEEGQEEARKSIAKLNAEKAKLQKRIKFLKDALAKSDQTIIELRDGSNTEPEK